jgi:DNA-binding transcriptional regulator YiaG
MTINSPGLKRSELTKFAEQNFLKRCGPPDAKGCIPWQGRKTPGGYGYFQCGFGPRRIVSTASRFVWVLARGDIPEGALVLHRCDNPECVNIEHLFLGTPQDNMDDKVAKKRHPHGESASWTKMMEADWERVRDIRRCWVSQAEVAKYFGISQQLVSLKEREGSNTS